MSEQHTITFAKWPNEYGQRGRKKIFVNDVHWGTINMASHGMHGVSYTFVQEGQTGNICDPKDLDFHKQPRAVEVRQRTKRRLRRDGEPLLPAETVLEAKVRELIKRGLLRHPNIVKHERDEARKRAAENRRAAAEVEEKLFRHRACEALGINQDDGSEVIDRVVAAMRWAQSQ